MSQSFNSFTENMTPPVLFDLADYIDEFSRQLRRVGNDNERRLNERRNSARHRQAITSACIFFLDQVVRPEWKQACPGQCRCEVLR